VRTPPFRTLLSGPVNRPNRPLGVAPFLYSKQFQSDISPSRIGHRGVPHRRRHTAALPTRSSALFCFTIDGHRARSCSYFAAPGAALATHCSLCCPPRLTSWVLMRPRVATAPSVASWPLRPLCMCSCSMMPTGAASAKEKHLPPAMATVPRCKRRRRPHQDTMHV
jgi:hypothetical protein